MSMPTIDPDLTGAARFDAAAAALDIAPHVKVFDASTRTAEDAAAAIGCTVAQIAKSIIFKDPVQDRPVLVIASGVNRIDTKATETLARVKVPGLTLGKADGRWVRETTGYTIGGVAPIGHRIPCIVIVDRDLLALDPVWAAAGTPNRVTRIPVPILVEKTNALVGSIVASV